MPDLRFSDGILVAANSIIERRWRLEPDGALTATALIDRRSGRDWLTDPKEPGTTPPGPPLTPPLTVIWREDSAPDALVAEPCRWGELTVTGADGRGWQLQMHIFADGPGVTCRLHRIGPVMQGDDAGVTTGVATGIEGALAIQARTAPDDRCESMHLAAHHVELVEVELQDRTDCHDNLALVHRRRLAPGSPVARRGVLFAIEDVLTRDGLILLHHAPLPHARSVATGEDLVADHRQVVLRGHGWGDTGLGWAWSVAVYQGGDWGRTTALHRLQRNHRAFDPARDGRLVTNTWGDRNRDGRICEDFIRQEIAAAAALGADVVQIDDGWQRGISAGSVHAAKGGVWQGFWAADAQFWAPHPQRFPAGLEPVAAAARRAGIGLGLWFAPDSADDFANWRRDADTVLDMHRRLGVRLVKVDAVKAMSKRGEANLEAFLRAVLVESGGAVAFDLDITAEIRPGYVGPGSLTAGPLFVENRYTDWGRWWPHATLRTLWQLAWHIPPQRLRMEFLNPARNQERYAGDPLAPMTWPWDYAFASVMVANPLGWFEISGLPAAMIEALRPVVAAWRRHRADLHGGTVLPIGACPDGTSWTGFCSLQTDGRAHVIAFREHIATDRHAFRLPPGTRTGTAITAITAIAGRGSATWEGDQLTIAIPAMHDWAWFTLG